MFDRFMFVGLVVDCFLDGGLLYDLGLVIVINSVDCVC